mmetsp:Transcript_54175/g.118528  ORF Transcript_54175/g.118528 Transcript_54175/m.118528 type:complete len:448 (-) Transcript_54175:158-1501(-)
MWRNTTSPRGASRPKSSGNFPEDFEGSGNLFESADRNGDGLVSAAEFRRFRDSTHPRGNTVLRPGPPSSHVFAAVDANQNGSVSIDEFNRFREAADRNRDGVISPDEWHQFEESLVPPPPRMRGPGGGYPSSNEAVYGSGVYSRAQERDRDFAAASARSSPQSTGRYTGARSGVDRLGARMAASAHGSPPPGRSVEFDEAFDTPEDREVLEFLEGLLEGFRAAVGYVPKGAAGDWADLDDLPPMPSAPSGGSQGPGESPHSRSLNHGGRSPLIEGEVPDSAAMDPMATSMRRQALRAFLEDSCETVANAFDALASLSLRASLGGSGTQQDRLRHQFTEDELRRSLTSLGYGAGASRVWWRSLFRSLDVDGDNLVSLQDMYDALVLYLPPVMEPEKTQVFFQTPSTPAAAAAAAAGGESEAQAQEQGHPVGGWKRRQTQDVVRLYPNR